jgi:hypothetical protein
MSMSTSEPPQLQLPKIAAPQTTPAVKDMNPYPAGG